ncbi:MAG: acyl-CoA ligase (AMP-forming), exosortase A system-associated [Rhodocyclaceae bacterium]|nr:acyl-CoA ligase (AMP-forming), exosortase A system-associated [Rhodocyclaceae bacterium]
MKDTVLLHELVINSAQSTPEAEALTHDLTHFTYLQLASQITCFAGAVHNLGLALGERVAVYLEKRFENVIACFGTSAAGCIFVPINPLLKPDQVAYILRDCGVRLLITSQDRRNQLAGSLTKCPDLQHVICVDSASGDWEHFLKQPENEPPRQIDSDPVAIFYTSGSTGAPKGVVLSHRNMVAGAKSVASYLDNTASDTLLALLPLSFDAGFSQLTTAFLVGARVVLLNYLLPRDVVKVIEREKITGLTAVPPLYIQLAQLTWAPSITRHLRYFANTGGRMPRDTLLALRQHLPETQPFLMYGLTEAFRSSYLPPAEVDRRPDSIGKAIPNVELLVLRADGSHCAANEPGELVHRGPLVSMGYWNKPEATAERFKALPSRVSGLVLPEIAVFSGDNVRMDEEGYLYFIGRSDEMIKTSGYRVSPSEVEEILYATQMVSECIAFGVANERLGQSIQVIATHPQDTLPDIARLLAECRSRMPAYMVPAGIELRSAPLPRNPNGKIDRKLLSTAWIQQNAA